MDVGWINNKLRYIALTSSLVTLENGVSESWKTTDSEEILCLYLPKKIRTKSADFLQYLDFNTIGGVWSTPSAHTIVTTQLV